MNKTTIYKIKDYEVGNKEMSDAELIIQSEKDLNMHKLLLNLLPEIWQWQCTIICNHDNSGKCVIRYDYINKCNDKKSSFLRHSSGPDNNYFWDIYGSDFICPELAIVALSKTHAPYPRSYHHS